MSMNDEPDRDTSIPTPKQDTQCYICGRVFFDTEFLDEDFMGSGKKVCDMCCHVMKDKVLDLFEILSDKIRELR